MTDYKQKLSDIAKREGVHVIAKIMVADNRSYGMSEADLVDLISNHDRRDGESSAQCFSRHFEARDENGLALRKAIVIAKAAELQNDSDAEAEAAAEADAAEAIRELQKIGAQRWQGSRGRSSLQELSKPTLIWPNARIAGPDLRPRFPSPVRELRGALRTCGAPRGSSKCTPRPVAWWRV